MPETPPLATAASTSGPTPAERAFLERWLDSAGAERANKDSFLIDLCDALELPRPEPKRNDPALDLYCFERSVPKLGPDKTSSGSIDLYREGAFVLEAKQGGDGRRFGTAKRNTPAWNMAMQDAYGQALGYARALPKRPPFLVVCDLGHCFDLYASFDGSGDYRPFPDAIRSRLWLKDLPQHRELLRGIWLDPLALDPARLSAKVTTEIAIHLGELAERLQRAGHDQELAAGFLIRCLFTMFVEDVGLLPDRVFTKGLAERWLPHPEQFPSQVTTLWRAMNDGSPFGFEGKILCFNGGLFAEPVALPLDKEALAILLEASQADWSAVEPSIFGTLIEQALEATGERQSLGAHYTPRAYVERLVKPTLEEPLRADWDAVKTKVAELVERGTKKALTQAESAVLDFHRRLAATRVLDPACGTGNFLYVALDLFKRLESEVLELHARLTGKSQSLLGLAGVSVGPHQFLGIELKPLAKAIAEIVLWIGHLQWQRRTYPNVPPVEPILHDYGNIECRDAVLAYDKEELVTGPDGRPVTTWDGVTMKVSPVTGKEVPDESARKLLYRYTNPRKAEWPEAEFVVGNPPFIGNKRMRQLLGPGYVDALRAARQEVPASADYVMYWWDFAATNLAKKGVLRRFGFVTTNSITQGYNSRIVEQHLKHCSLRYAVPDHPWTTGKGAAQVRIAMSVLVPGKSDGVLQEVRSERAGSEPEPQVELTSHIGRIGAQLAIGTNTSALLPLAACRGLACPGVQLSGQGFVLSHDELMRFDTTTRNALIRPYLTGRDLTQVPRQQYVIDTFGFDEATLQRDFPDAFQWLLERVKPERMQNPRASYRKNWWLHSETRSKFRAALVGLPRFIGTSRTARHRVFQFLPGACLPETKVLIVALGDGFDLGVLSSRVHVVFSLSTGGWLGVGNDSTYNHSTCFLPFPFPAPTDAQRKKIADLGERLDQHRKARQAAHPELTMTAMYNVLEKLRAGTTLTAKDKKTHDQGLCSVLLQLHDELDRAVADAYNWPAELPDDELLTRLVALNAERAEEEKNGLVRWLRPEFQQKAAQTTSPDEDPTESDEPADTPTDEPPQKPAWPGRVADRVKLVKAALSTTPLTATELSARFTGADESSITETLDALVELELATKTASGHYSR